ncbi:MAG: hypothetical protein WCC76_17515, partial [Candidatus Acidiferrales bacterium]
SGLSMFFSALWMPSGGVPERQHVPTGSVSDLFVLDHVASGEWNLLGGYQASRYTDGAGGQS